MNVKPELMSPAGHWPQLQTAIEAGADAVYFGLNHFSARAKVGFDLSEISDVMETLHGRCVKGFVTFNTLIFDHEWQQAEQAICRLADAGVDAVIVQDVGLAQRIKQWTPDLSIHGSTQMSITSAEGVELAQSFGCSRVVLGRELSLADIRRIRAATDVELEVFVHGALCVSYSGQCFSSEAWGGRSANRGQCAQACRLSYDLIVDGQPRDLGEFRYLLSPGDLYALDQVPELTEIGVACFKIEGRYKDADYVALTTSAYRQAIDAAWENRKLSADAELQLQLEQVYSRGLGAHFISGTNHQTVVVGRAPRHRGVLVGEVLAVNKRSVVVSMKHPINRGDGLVFDSAVWRSPDEPEEGGNVYDVHHKHRGNSSEAAPRAELEFGHHEIDFSRIRIGDWVWRTRDPQLQRQLKSLTRNEVPVFTRPVSLAVIAKVGHPLEVTATLTGHNGQPIVATYRGVEPVTKAEKRPLDQEILRDKLGRLGGTPYHLGELQLQANDDAFVRTSELNEARRQLVDQLFRLAGQASGSPSETSPTSASPEQAPPEFSRLPQVATLSDDPLLTPSDAPQLHVLVRSDEQLDAVLRLLESLDRDSKSMIGSLTLDYLELYGLRQSVDKIREHGLRPRVASPRILKPSEQKVVHFLNSLPCDLLVRSGGLLHALHRDHAPTENDASEMPRQLIGDFSLNAANVTSCQSLLALGLTRITPTYDLNASQIAELAQAIPTSQLEIIAYSHLPVFHTEHCVFCRFLSTGTDNTNCGHPCEQHRLAVRDHQGREHPVLADVGCRNTVFGAEAQTDPAAIKNWLEAGLRHFRMEFVHQNSSQIEELIRSLIEFWQQRRSVESLASTWKLHSPQSTSAGSLFTPRDYRQLVQLN